MAQLHFSVSGMTCGHCVGHVTEELTALPGVTDVNITLVAQGASPVVVTVADGEELPAEADIVAALEEAGDYVLNSFNM